jgi:hypothetical protein
MAAAEWWLATICSLSIQRSPDSQVRVGGRIPLGSRDWERDCALRINRYFKMNLPWRLLNGAPHSRQEHCRATAGNSASTLVTSYEAPQFWHVKEVVSGAGIRCLSLGFRARRPLSISRDTLPAFAPRARPAAAQAC